MAKKLLEQRSGGSSATIKKAAKKVASKAASKKAAKKSAKKSGEHSGRSDSRRAFEHLGRLHALRPLLQGEAVEHLTTLSRYAQAAVHGQEPFVAADLLRAAEHLAFGSLAPENAVQALTKELRTALEEEFRHRLDRAKDRWDDQESKPARELRSLYKELRSWAKLAWKQDAYNRGLEFARAADALAHAAPAGLRLTDSDQKGPLALEAAAERD